MDDYREFIKRVNGRLKFDGCDAVELAEEYGTPVYIVSESELVSRIRELKEFFDSRYPDGRVAYASKAFSCLEMMRLCNREDAYVEVVSGGELYMAKAAGVPGERIEFNGNNKSKEELTEALDYGVGRIIVDGLTELSLIEEVWSRGSKKVPILFRVTPGVAVSTHDHMVTGKKDSKFGIPMDDETLFSQINHALCSDAVELMGLHFHIGSLLFEVEPYLKALDMVLAKVGEIRKRFGYVVKELNLGGGFGINYTHEDYQEGKRKAFEYFLDPMIERIENYYDDLGEARPSVVIEPGRSIVGEAGMTLYKIGQIKEIPGVRKYVSVDGGMGDNIRPALYDAEHRMEIANPGPDEEGIVENGNTGNKRPLELVTICGKYCESGDILAKDILLPKPETGDILAVFSTGAYNFSMASNYNMNPIPPVVFCKDGESKLVVKRESYQHLLLKHL